MKKTALYEEHISKNAKMVEFSGFLMPLSYSSIITEHMTVRNYAGLFDVSHMGEILVYGNQALDFLNYICTNNLSKKGIGDISYSPICYKNATTVDDLLIYFLEENVYLVVVNASNIQKDYDWFIKNNKFDCNISNLSNKYSQIALQGPKSEEIMHKIYPDIKLPTFYKFTKCNDDIISRTGYTGEDGFEIYTNNERVINLWNDILSENDNVKPIGLGARDTLRFEASLPLYGHELSDKISPIEAGLKRFVDISKENFIGKEVLKKQLDSGKHRTIVALELTKKSIAREKSPIFCNELEIGYVTSGMYSPYFKKSLALGLIDSKHTDCKNITIKIRKNNVSCKKVGKPFYKPKYKK